MKNLLVVFIALFTHTLFAQDAKVEINIQNLSKKWVFKDVINPEKNATDLAEMREMLAATTLQLNQDGSYIFDFVDTRKGTWMLDAANKLITLKENNRAAKNEWTVHSLTKNELIASRNEATQKIVFTAQ